MAAVAAAARRPIGRGELIAAMPRTSRRPRSRRELVSAFAGEPRLASLRGDFAARVADTVRILAGWASFEDGGGRRDPRGCTRPGRDQVAAEAGYSVSTWKACRRVLEAWGWLVLIRPGRTAEFRLRSLRPALHYEGNDAAVYLLLIPRSPRWPRKTAPRRPRASASRRTRPPSRADVGSRFHHARGPVDRRPGTTPLRGGSLPPAHWLALQDHPVLKKLSERASGRLWRDFERRAWTLAQWRRAFDCGPDGRPHLRDGSGVLYPASWADYRLAFWRGPDGLPLPPPSMQAAVDRQPARAAAAAQMAGIRAGRAAGTEATAEWHAARQEMRRPP